MFDPVSKLFIRIKSQELNYIINKLFLTITERDHVRNFSNNTYEKTSSGRNQTVLFIAFGIQE